MAAIQNGMPTPIARSGNRIAAAAPPAIQFIPASDGGIQLYPRTARKAWVRLLVPSNTLPPLMVARLSSWLRSASSPNVTPNTGTRRPSARHAASNVDMAPWLFPSVMMTMAGRCWPASSSGFIAASARAPQV